MSKDHYDAIYASVPLNATAGAVVSRGYEYTPAVKPGGGDEWENPPPFAKLSKGVDDLTGATRGRLRVVGYLGSGKNGSRWVCRCACGRYVARNSKSIRNEANGEDRCKQCRHVAQLAKEASADRIAERKAKGCERLFAPTHPQDREDTP